MKKCPYCAEDIQDAAIVCRYCGRKVEVADKEKKKTGDPTLMFLLNLFGTPIGIIAVYFSLMLIVYILRLNLSLGTNGSLFFCGVFVIVYLVAASMRRKYLTDTQKEKEDAEVDYWQDRGH